MMLLLFGGSLVGLFTTIVTSTSSLVLVVDAYSLQGKRAIVTGSSGGIGRGIALELTRQGCQVLVHYNTRVDGARETANLINNITNSNIAYKSMTGVDSRTGGGEGGGLRATAITRSRATAITRARATGAASSSAATTTTSSYYNSQGCAGILQCDFRYASNLERFQRSVDKIWPDGYDILINNAGIIGKLALEDDDDVDDARSHWNDIMAVNLHAPRRLSQWAVPRMNVGRRPGGGGIGGVIVHVSSIHGETSNEYMGAYAASKAALDSLTKTMAIEYAVHNIRVNAIAPGIVIVERTAETLSDPMSQQPWLDHLLVNRLGSVDDVAQATLPLLTNDWVTGTIWKVDGGITARGNLPKRDRPLKMGGIA